MSFSASAATSWVLDTVGVADQQGTALTAHERGEESVEPGQFGRPADDHLRGSGKGRNGAMRAHRHECRVISHSGCEAG